MRIWCFTKLWKEQRPEKATTSRGLPRDSSNQKIATVIQVRNSTELLPMVINVCSSRTSGNKQSNIQRLLQNFNSLNDALSAS